MARILFLSSRDTRVPHAFGYDYETSLKAIGNNTGNVLFMHAVQFYMELAGTDYDVIFYAPSTPKLHVDWSKYSHCIINVANWLSVRGKPFLEKIAADFADVKVPTFMIGLGAQAPRGTSAAFIDEASRETSSFIRAILATGGGFGLRGEFTAQCFDRLGFKDDYTVTGCPSAYQRGRDLAIAPEKVQRKDFRPLLNGRRELRHEQLLKDAFQYAGHFICQDDMLRLVEFFPFTSAAERRGLLTRSDTLLKMIASGHVRLFADVDDWTAFIAENGFNFSYGGRIHGNMVALLSGVPSVVVAADTRTREIADFFNIPAQDEMAYPARPDLFQHYLEADYVAFNAGFAARFDAFAQFLQDKGLPLALPQPDRSMLPQTLALQKGMPGGIDLNPDLTEYIESYLAFKPIGMLEKHVSKRTQYIISRRLSGSYV